MGTKLQGEGVGQTKSKRGANNFGAPIVLDSLGVNKYANKKLGENKVICESYRDYRYF